VSGWTEFKAWRSGGFSFSGHLHNSGAVNIRCTVMVYMIAHSGDGFFLTVENKRLDGTEVLFGRNRDFNWDQNFKGPPTWTRKREDLTGSRFAAKIIASSEAGSGIKELAHKIVDEAYKALPDQTGKQLAKPAVYFLLTL